MKPVNYEMSNKMPIQNIFFLVRATFLRSPAPFY